MKGGDGMMDDCFGASLLVTSPARVIVLTVSLRECNTITLVYGYTYPNA